MGAPCNFWHPRQWHIFASTGSAATSYSTALQKQLARYFAVKPASVTDAYSSPNSLFSITLGTYFLLLLIFSIFPARQTVRRESSILNRQSQWL
jgi:hypothetical protein